MLAQIEESGSDSKIIPTWPVHEVVVLKREANWQHSIKGMISVLHSDRGTARSSGYRLPFIMAGKTGTAQVFGIAQDEEYDAETIAKKLQDHALFVAFAPQDNPKIAVAVIAENGGHGSSVAAPIARKVIDEWIRIGKLEDSNFDSTQNKSKP